MSVCCCSHVICMDVGCVDGIEGMDGTDDMDGMDGTDDMDGMDGTDDIAPIAPIAPTGAYAITPGIITGTIPPTGCTATAGPLLGSSTCISSLSSTFPEIASFFSLFLGIGSPSNSLMNSKYAWSRFRDSSTFLRSWRNGQSRAKCEVSPQMLQVTFAGVKLSRMKLPIIGYVAYWDSYTGCGPARRKWRKKRHWRPVR